MKAQEQVVSQSENQYLKLNHKQRLNALKTTSAEVQNNSNPTEQQKQNYADSIIAIQHMIADRATDQSLKQKPNEVQVFSELFTTHLKIMAQKNIMLPQTTEVFKPEERSFVTYVTAIKKILDELTALRQKDQSPTEQQKQEFSQTLISFQRFLTQLYNSNDLDRNTFPLIESSLQLFATTINACANSGIKLPTNEIKQLQVEPVTTDATDNPLPPVENQQSLPERFKAILADIKTKYPGWSSRIQETIARGIAYYEAETKGRQEQALQKKKAELLALGAKMKAEKEKEEQKKAEILKKISELRIGDEIQVLNSKNKVVETHTVTKKHEKSIDVKIYNHQSKQTTDRTKYFTHYVDPDYVFDIRVIKKTVNKQPEPAPSRPEAKASIQPLIDRAESKKTFGFDGNLLSSFQIGKQKFGIFQIHPDNRNPFLQDRSIGIANNVNHLIVQLSPSLEASSKHFKGLREGETVVLGREQLVNRFDYAQDNSLSKRHVEIKLVANKIIITDLQSTNGTHSLSKERLLATKTKLKQETEQQNAGKREIIGENNQYGLSESIQVYRSNHGSEIAAGSDKGIDYKDHNEDRVVVNVDSEFFAVVDGMGGYSGGDTAAQIVAEKLKDANGDTATAIENAKNEIKSAIDNKIIENKEAGATFISAKILRENGNIKVEYAYSGDCSMLVLDINGNIKHVSKGHSYLNSSVYLARNNNIPLTDDQQLYHPQRNVVMQAVDQKNSRFTTDTISVAVGDRVILMSDGINDNLTPEEIAREVRNKNPQEAIQTIDTITSNRMKNANAIINGTPDRANSGVYRDGYKSMPKNDNRGLLIVDIK